MVKDFWNQVIFFVSKDINLTKAHVRYLEGRLIELSRAAERAVVTNGQSGGSKLPESDRDDMEVFLEKMCQLLPVLGVDLLVSLPLARRRQQRQFWCVKSKGTRQEDIGPPTVSWS